MLTGLNYGRNRIVRGQNAGTRKVTQIYCVPEMKGTQVGWICNENL